MGKGVCGTCSELKSGIGQNFKTKSHLGEHKIRLELNSGKPEITAVGKLRIKGGAKAAILNAASSIGANNDGWHCTKDLPQIYEITLSLNGVQAKRFNFPQQGGYFRSGICTNSHQVGWKTIPGFSPCKGSADPCEIDVQVKAKIINQQLFEQHKAGTVKINISHSQFECDDCGDIEWVRTDALKPI